MGLDVLAQAARNRTELAESFIARVLRQAEASRAVVGRRFLWAAENGYAKVASNIFEM